LALLLFLKGAEEEIEPNKPAATTNAADPDSP
jgi:hypothetical protein